MYGNEYAEYVLVRSKGKHKLASVCVSMHACVYVTLFLRCQHPTLSYSDFFDKPRLNVWCGYRIITIFNCLTPELPSEKTICPVMDNYIFTASAQQVEIAKNPPKNSQ